MFSTLLLVWSWPHGALHATFWPTKLHIGAAMLRLEHARAFTDSSSLLRVPGPLVQPCLQGMRALSTNRNLVFSCACRARWVVNPAACAQVSQLHVHVTARDTGDPSWPGPCYGAVPATPHAPFARQALIQRLKKALVEHAPAPHHQTRRPGQVRPDCCAIKLPRSFWLPQRATPITMLPSPVLSRTV